LPGLFGILLLLMIGFSIVDVQSRCCIRVRRRLLQAPPGHSPVINNTSANCLP
jgi:hypothetical protein